MNDAPTYLGQLAGGETASVSMTARLRHTAILGATGMGKSTLMKAMLAQDIARGDGVMLIDPHGPLAEDVLSLIPPSRYDHTCYIDLADSEHAVGFNLVACEVSADRRALAVSSTVSAIKSIWGQSWGPRLEEVLKSALAILVEQNGATIAWVPRLLHDRDWREALLANTTNPMPHAFFSQVFAQWPEREQAEAIGPVFNKISALLHPPAIRYVVGQTKSTLDLAYAMERGRIVIVNLAKGSVDDIPAFLFGALMLAHVKTTALARSEPHSAQALPPLPRRGARLRHRERDEAPRPGAQVPGVDDARDAALERIRGRAQIVINGQCPHHGLLPARYR